MYRSQTHVSKRSLAFKVVAFFAALGLHVALLAAMVSRSEPQLPELAGEVIHYIDLGDSVMPGEESDEEPGLPETSEVDATESDVEPEPEPIPEPEPEPEPVSEPEPEPEPIPEPEPEPEPIPEPEPEPEPTPEP